MAARKSNWTVEIPEILHTYFKLGWRAVPLRGKIPYMQNWQNAHLTEEEFKAQYKPGDNVGLVTGWLIKDKQGLMALDIDQPGLIGFKHEPWIEKGAMAHTTSVGTRVVFYTDSHEVIRFSRKVTVAPGQLSDAERNLLNWKAWSSAFHSTRIEGWRFEKNGKGGA